jgi:alpha-D-ribose 1-methylphosphonate 5-triphosphate synthase subunit PhnG
MTTETRSHAESVRRKALAILARADLSALAEAWRGLPEAPVFEVLRRPEFGLVMARGRIGGGGAPFNLGEVTMTRCVVRLETGEVGYGNVMGRDAERAELVARFDALAQAERYREYVNTNLLAPVAARAQREDETVRQETAATRVNFFTMVRGEDE